MKIYFFRDHDGSKPVGDFLKNLTPTIRSRFMRYLNHVMDNDGYVRGVFYKKLHSYPLEEIRVKERKKLHRVIIKTKIADCVIVLHGFTKKEGQPTPKKELEIAYQRYLTIKDNRHV